MKIYENLVLVKGGMESPEFRPNAFVSQFLHKQPPRYLYTQSENFRSPWLPRSFQLPRSWSLLNLSCLLAQSYAYHPIQQLTLCPSSLGKGTYTLSYLNTSVRKYCLYLTKIYIPGLQSTLRHPDNQLVLFSPGQNFNNWKETVTHSVPHPTPRLGWTFSSSFLIFFSSSVLILLYRTLPNLNNQNFSSLVQPQFYSHSFTVCFERIGAQIKTQMFW